MNKTESRIRGEGHLFIRPKGVSSEGSYRDNRQQRGIENQLKKKRDEANTGEEREDGASEGTAPKKKKAKKAKTKKESAAAPALPVFVPQNAWW